jgi:hypothetical protein
MLAPPAPFPHHPSMPNPPSPPTNTRELRRQRLILKAAIAVLVIGALLIALLAKNVALPLRLFVASTDLILAAVLWLLLRQKFSSK